ncbi:hypothetical protein [Kitasatospora sp. NPDC091207]|uniref:hypothetical protein n=1 Tax=Kitasatospora sp. NPDC091207 TaxID=3364083 RepID=UPI0037F24B57
MELDFVGYDSTGLPEKGLWEADPDELFGRRTPDEDQTQVRFSYCVGTFHQLHLMVDGATGAVEVYNPDGWDHADGHGGLAAPSLPALAGALGLLARLEQRLTGSDTAAALEEFTALLGRLGQGPGDPDLWPDLLEEPREEYADPDG